MTRKLVTAGLSLSVAASGLLLTGPAGATAPAALATVTSTPYAMGASGYSTKISGGQLPAGSDQTAFTAIGCTNKAGLLRRNWEADLNLLPLVDVQAATTRLTTTSSNGVVGSTAVNKIAQVSLGDSSTAGTPVISGITSQSSAFHDASGFHATTSTTVASVDPDGVGPLPPVSGPTAANPVITIPGVATISLGTSTKQGSSNGAFAKADALVIRLLPTGTVVTLAHSRANIGATTGGVFRGSSYGSKVTAADRHLSSRMTPYTLMPCLGTDGVIFRKDVARVNPSGLVIRGLTASESADQSNRTAYAWERGRVARLNLGHGKLVVKGVVGKARVNYSKAKGFTTNIKGSTVLAVFSNGKNQGAFPRSGVINIPGIARLRQNVVNRTPRSIEVTAVRITLLNGTGAVINLGHAKVGFSGSPL